jgi:glycosyltransferase involved in cell wall biosynthesis
MHVSVLICTWNRAALLDQTLTQFAKLRIPKGIDWELLVVNNRSTDATQDVLVNHAARLPLRSLYEERPGKSFAANLAVEQSRGDLLLWTDDDVLVDPSWLEAYVRAAARWPQATFFGGTVEPLFATAPPKWLIRNLAVLGGVFALIDPRPDGQPIGRRDVPPVGANMALRRRAFEALRFNTFLGPVRDTRVCGEETELIHALQDAGHQGVWVGSAKLQHYTPPGRLTKKYIWDYWVGMGRTDARLNFGKDFPLLGGAPRWAVRQYLTARLALRLFASFEGPRWAQALCRAAKMKGIITEWRRLREFPLVNSSSPGSPLPHCAV